MKKSKENLILTIKFINFTYNVFVVYKDET